MSEQNDAKVVRGENVETELNPKYLDEILKKIPYNQLPHIDDGYFNNLVVGLLVQTNLLLDKLCNLMVVATGLNMHDTSADNALDSKAVKEAAEQHGNTVCGQCGRGVVPDRFGYCPRCGNDLRGQIMREQL